MFQASIWFYNKEHMQWKLQWKKKKNPKPFPKPCFREVYSLCVYAYAECLWLLTDPLSVLRNSCAEGPPFFSHLVMQRTSKLMEGWPVAQHHDRLAGSPELKPLAWGLQAWGWRLTGPSYEGLMNGFWHRAGDVCEFVCVCKLMEWLSGPP